MNLKDLKMPDKMTESEKKKYIQLANKEIREWIKFLNALGAMYDDSQTHIGKSDLETIINEMTRDFSSISYPKIKSEIKKRLWELCRISDDVKKDLPIGVSAWKEMGKKYGFYEYFLNRYEKQYTELKMQVEECLRHCEKQNGMPMCKNCGINDENIK